MTPIDAGVDWSAPWLAGIRELACVIAQADDWRAELNRQAQQCDLRNHSGNRLRFIQQQELPAGAAYEAHIFATGEVPTRDNLHDFFNALVWLTYPRIKVQLNALQAAQIARLGVGKSRGAARDAATLFDENAALLAVSDTPAGQKIVQALRQHQWDSVFVQQQPQFLAHAKVFLFGHALMEKLTQPYKAITAHTLVCWVDQQFHHLSPIQQRAQLDRQLAAQLDREQGAQELLPSAFSPLPILGVPGWWPDQDAQFYADSSVFRPARQPKNLT